jgi:ferrochelatase
MVLLRSSLNHCQNRLFISKRLSSYGKRAMPPAGKPSDHPPVASGRIGVLLVNLGTPEGTDYWSMRRYLREFLSDRRVIETSRAIWLPILHLIILTTRPGRKGRDYAAIWNGERDEGPLKTYTRSQSEKLGSKIAAEEIGSEKIVVDWAMRYGQPTIASRIAALQAQGCDRLLVLPLYPQYCAATSATVADCAFDALKQLRWQPTLRISAPFYDRPSYIAALAKTMREKLAELDFEPERILVSWHGIPQSYFDQGDPYYCHCAVTTRLLGEATGLADRMLMTFQSQFGPREWLKPYTLETVKRLAGEGVKTIAVIAPGFFADCLETLEELGVENRESFIEAGGENFALIPCLNDSGEAIDVLADLCRTELGGWI